MSDQELWLLRRVLNDLERRRRRRRSAFDPFVLLERVVRAGLGVVERSVERVVRKVIR